MRLRAPVYLTFSSFSNVLFFAARGIIYRRESDGYFVWSKMEQNHVIGKNCFSLFASDKKNNEVYFKINVLIIECAVYMYDQ